MSILQRVLAGEPRVTCSNCLESRLPRLDDVPTENGGAIRQMTCPACGYVTPVAVFTKYGLQLVDQIQEAAAKRDQKLVMRLQKKLQGEIRRP